MTKEEKKEYEQRIEDMNELLLVCTSNKLQFATDVYQYISILIEGTKKKLEPTEDHKE